MDLQAALNKVNTAAKRKTNDLLPLIKLKDLETRKLYKITKIYIAKTKYGPKVMVNLHGTHAMFIPSTTSDCLIKNPSEYNIFQSAARENKLLMVYFEPPMDFVQFRIDDTQGEDQVGAFESIVAQ